jgi:transposase
MVIEIDKEELDRYQELIRQQAKRIQQLEEEVQQLKKLLEGRADAKAAKKPEFTENYSLDRNKRNKQKKKRKKSTGRRTNEAKRELATLEVDVYRDGVTREDCIRHRSQLVWRMIDGKAVYVCYHIYDVPESRNLPLPPAVRNSRCECGMEIILIVAFLHYWIGVSLDHACQIMEFFTGLKLPKSQADSLLSQLATDWDEQYDTIAELIALQMIVYIDETGWKVGKKSCYTWVFSTAMHVLFRCGVSRKKEEAIAVLGNSFDGIGVTDDYAAYKNLFSKHQLCWAHLIHKAIKLALQHPDQPQYATFLDHLCGIYDDAKRLQMDGRLSAGREEKSRQLEDRVQSLCTRRDETIVKDVTPGHEETFILLQRELCTNLECLFVFVEHPEVEPTNNRSERNARREAEIRKGARTSKSESGAHRRSVIVMVLASLQT